MKVSAPLLAQLLLASSTWARLFQKTTEVKNASKNEEDIDRIINGVEAKEDRYSYMVSLKDNKGKFICCTLHYKFINFFLRSHLNEYAPYEKKVTFAEHPLLLTI